MVETGPRVVQPKQQRPLSPHLQVYKPQITSVLSITHRATGIFLTMGLALFAWWIVALASGPDAFAAVQSFIISPLGLILMLGWVGSLYFHLCNGIRHLFWDAGYGFSLEATYRSGWAVVIASFVLTAGTVIAVITIGGAL